MNIPMSESGRQVQEIMEELNDPVKIEQKKMKLNREKRAEQIREDTGL